MFATLSVFAAIAKYGGPAYKEWAQGQVDKIGGILNQAKEGHVRAVKERIGSVKKMGGVVEVTRDLFDVSRVSGMISLQDCRTQMM